MSRRRKQDNHDEVQAEADAAEKQMAEGAPEQSGEPAQGSDNASLTRIDMLELASGADISFEWLENKAWKSRLIGGRIVPASPDRTAGRDEHAGIEIFHAIDHIQIHYKGCVRSVPFSQVRYWGHAAPKEFAGV